MPGYLENDISFSKNQNLLGDWEGAVIDLFLNAANTFGLPKSYGQIYGLLFCRNQPLATHARALEIVSLEILQAYQL